MEQWPWSFFGASLVLGKCFGASSQSNHWAGHHWLSYKTHFLSPVKIWLSNGSLFHRIREDETSKWYIYFLFSVSSQGSYLVSFFTFLICFKCQLTVEWLMVSSETTSVVVRGTASMIFSVGSCPLPMVGTCTHHFQGSYRLCKTFWTTTAIHSLAVAGTKALLMSRVISGALWPIVNSN